MSTPSSLKNANQWLTPAQMKDLQEYQQMGGTITPGILIDMRKGLSLKRAVEKSAGLPAIPVSMPPPQPMPVPPKSPLMVQAMQAQQQVPKAAPKFNPNGEMIGTGKYLALYYIQQEPAPGTATMPRYVVKEYNLAINRSISPGTVTSIPADLYETREAAQAQLNSMYRDLLKRNVGEFLERLILCGLEQGVCDPPETDLAEALQQYLAAIKPGNQPVDEPEVTP